MSLGIAVHSPERANRDILRVPERSAFPVLLLTLVAFYALPLAASGSLDRQLTGAKPEEGREQAPLLAGQRRCEFFIVQKILSARQPTVISHWEKNGKLVFEVGFTMAGDKAQNSRLCVYDVETRGALLPAVGEQDQWRLK